MEEDGLQEEIKQPPVNSGDGDSTPPKSRESNDSPPGVGDGEREAALPGDKPGAGVEEVRSNTAMLPERQRCSLRSHSTHGARTRRKTLYRHRS